MGADQAKQLRMILKVFVSCLLALCAASSESSSSESGSGEFRGPGLYFSPIEVDLACTADSPLGAKLASAFETCLGGVEALNPEQVGEVASERRRRRPNKGRKCPTVEQIKAKMGQGMEGDWCVLSQLGWIDENGEWRRENENNETYTTTSTVDLMGLKPEVLAELDETASAMKTCAEDRVEMMQKRCAKKFSEEDKAELMEMGLKIQGYNCFKEWFHSACQKSVKSQIYSFFQAQAMAAASTEAPTTGAPATTDATTAAEVVIG